MITEPQVEQAKFDNFAVLEINGKRVLILLCKDKYTRDHLYSLLKNNPYAVKVFLSNDKTFTIAIEFLYCDFALALPTGKTIKDYFPLTWLSSGNVQLLTTGIKRDNGMLFWNDNYLQMDNPSLN